MEKSDKFAIILIDTKMWSIFRQIIQKINLKDFLRPKNFSFLLVDLIALSLLFFSVAFTLALAGKPAFRSLPLVSSLVSLLAPREEMRTEPEEISSEIEKEKFLDLFSKPTSTPTPIAGFRPTPTPVPPTPTPSFYAFIDGVAYIDENYNGSRESWEKGLMGKDINIWKMDDKIQLAAKVITNEDGYYKAKVSSPGRYQPQLGDLSMNYQYPVNRQVMIEKTGEVKRVNFPLVPLGKQSPEIGASDGVIQGITFSDTNSNGIQDTGEGGVHFYKINLYRTSDNSQVATTTSDDNGTFTFSNLPLTSYKIEAYNPTGQYTITKPTAYVTLDENHKIDNSARLGVIKNY